MTEFELKPADLEAPEDLPPARRWLSLHELGALTLLAGALTAGLMPLLG